MLKFILNFFYVSFVSTFLCFMSYVKLKTFVLSLDTYSFQIPILEDYWSLIVLFLYFKVISNQGKKYVKKYYLGNLNQYRLGIRKFNLFFKNAKARDRNTVKPRRGCLNIISVTLTFSNQKSRFFIVKALYSHYGQLFFSCLSAVTLSHLVTFL